MKNPILESRRKELKPIDRLKFLHSYYVQNFEFFREKYEEKIKSSNSGAGWCMNVGILKGKMYAYRDSAKELKELIKLIEKEL